MNFFSVEIDAYLVIIMLTHAYLYMRIMLIPDIELSVRKERSIYLSFAKKLHFSDILILWSIKEESNVANKDYYLYSTFIISAYKEYRYHWSIIVMDVIIMIFRYCYNL